MDSEEMEGAVATVVIEARAGVNVGWYERLRDLVDGGRVWRIDEHEHSIKRWRYVELRRWQNGQYAVVARKSADPLTPPILICDDFDEAFAEVMEQVDDLWPGGG